MTDLPQPQRFFVHDSGGGAGSGPNAACVYFASRAEAGSWILVNEAPIEARHSSTSASSGMESPYTMSLKLPRNADRTWLQRLFASATMVASLSDVNRRGVWAPIGASSY